MFVIDTNVFRYPAEKITIITSYNGQKHLIRDVIRQRCASNPIFGVPHKVTTVDRFQGQQNDCILPKFLFFSLLLVVVGLE
jgi:intron-binding protein aquarius